MGLFEWECVASGLFSAACFGVTFAFDGGLGWLVVDVMFCVAGLYGGLRKTGLV